MNNLPDISKDFALWYQEVIFQSELVDSSPVRGTMVIRPYGYALWEEIVNILDDKIKKTGHKNASFPLFIPESFLKKEAKHVEGFAPELAMVTHAGGKKLEEPLVVRPTSETIIHYMFARWIKSWRDLPLKINQWANVVRWELRPRAFLRTTEFFWQEGHTAHETLEQAQEQVLMMLNEYKDLAENYLAIPVVTGQKTETERFPGALETYTFEAFMQDGKALQMGTSHLLSQSFAHAFEMQFQNRDGVLAYPFLTSWGTTTRLVGALVMVHGDQKGLVLPPKVAPIQIIILLILLKNKDNTAVLEAGYTVASDLRKQGFRVEIDEDMHKSTGARFFHWEIRGVPIRIEIGPRDLEKKEVKLVDRIGLCAESISLDQIVHKVAVLLVLLQKTLFERAQERVARMWHKEEKLVNFGPILEKNNGIYQTGWCGSASCEQRLKEFKAFTRCLSKEKTFDTCFNCDKASDQDVVVAKSY